MFKNKNSQKITFLVLDTAANVPKTGDAANLTAYVSKDDGAVTVLGDTSATELDATNAPGLYSFDLTQAETNADKLVFSGKSSTSGVRVIPLLLYTTPAAFTSFTTPPTADENAAAVLDLADGVESGKTLRQALRLIAAALAGKRSNAGTATEQYDAVGSPGTARIVGNLDADGNGTPTLTP